MLTCIVCFQVCVLGQIYVFAICCCCCCSFHHLKPAGSAANSFFFCFVCSCLVFGLFFFPGGSHTPCQHRLTHCEPVFCPGSQMQNQKATVTIKLTCFDAFSLSLFFCISNVCFCEAGSVIQNTCLLFVCCQSSKLTMWSTSLQKHSPFSL